jgi:hypothetical protein
MDDRSESESESSLSDILDQRNEEGWEDVEDDTEAITVVSLFDNQTFTSAKEMLAHCKSSHEFDIWKVRSDFGISCVMKRWQARLILCRP